MRGGGNEARSVATRIAVSDRVMYLFVCSVGACSDRVDEGVGVGIKDRAWFELEAAQHVSLANSLAIHANVQ